LEKRWLQYGSKNEEKIGGVMKLIHATVVKNEEHCIADMLETVLPYVDESYIMIDDRTTDKTEEIAKSYGCHTKHVKFENFAKMGNSLRLWINGKSDWYIGIAPDEKIMSDFGEMLKPLIEEIDETDVDLVGFPRRHWEDLEMKKEYTKQKWYPDFQFRLSRNDFPRIHLINYVHEWVVGDRKRVRVDNKDIHHFNVYWKPRISYNFDEMNKLYNELKNKQKKDGGIDIWPEEMDIK
jgi:glycosyltransferase involved in cell wall biosynthesis